MSKKVNKRPRSKPKDTKRSEQMRSIWARMSPEERSARNRKGWESLSESERKKRVDNIAKVNRDPEKVKKWRESFRRWQEENRGHKRSDGSRGAAGLSDEESVKLFFAANPEATDKECAETSGLSLYTVRRYRDPRSKKPFRRQLVAPIVRREPSETIVKYLNNPEPPHTKSRVDDRKIKELLRLVAGNVPLYKAYKRSGVSRNAGERIVNMILEFFGGYTPSDWRQSNRWRNAKVDQK